MRRSRANGSASLGGVQLLNALGFVIDFGLVGALTAIDRLASCLFDEREQRLATRLNEGAETVCPEQGRIDEVAADQRVEAIRRNGWSAIAALLQPSEIQTGRNAAEDAVRPHS